MTRAPILAALVLAACGDPAPAGFSTGPGGTSVSAVPTSGSSTGLDTHPGLLRELADQDR